MTNALEKKPMTSFASKPELRPEEIQLIAYQLFLERGMEDGHDLEDWFKAEEEVVRRKTMAAVA